VHACSGGALHYGRTIIIETVVRDIRADIDQRL